MGLAVDAVGGAAAALAARKIRAKAKTIAAHLLEVGEADLEWEVDRFKVKGNPEQSKTMKEIAMVAHTGNLPDGWSRAWMHPNTTTHRT